MAHNKLTVGLKYIFSPRRWISAVRHPRNALLGYAIPFLKYRHLFYKTRNVGGLITPEVGVLLYEAVIKTQHRSPNVVEVGAYQGMSTIYLAEAARRSKKRVKSFDTFAGLTELDPVLDLRFGDGDCVSEPDIWEANLKKSGLRDTVDLTIGDARRTVLPALNGHGFAVAFLDVDLYEVTRDLLLQLLSVIKGGEVIFIHNAYSPGIKKAVSEFHARAKYPVREQTVAAGSTTKLTVPFF